MGARDLYNGFEDAVAIGAYMSRSRLSYDPRFAAKTFASFALAQAGNGSGLNSEMRELRDAGAAALRRHRQLYEMQQQLYARLLVAETSVGDRFIEVTKEILASPCFGTLFRLRRETTDDAAVDLHALATFYKSLRLAVATEELRSESPNPTAWVTQTIQKATADMLETHKSICSKILGDDACCLGQVTPLLYESRSLDELLQASPKSAVTFPLIQQRRLLMYELCDDLMDNMAIEPMTQLYGAQRCVNRLDWMRWYSRLPLYALDKLVRSTGMCLTISMLQSLPTGIPDSVENLLLCVERAGFELRSISRHLGDLYAANLVKKIEYERSSLTADFWKNKNIWEDNLRSDTLKPQIGDAHTEDENRAGFLKDDAFYVDCNGSGIIFNLDFMTYYTYGRALLGLVFNSCALDPSMKEVLIALDAQQQQKDRARIIGLGPLFMRPCLTLEIRRDSILDDALNKLVLAQVWEGHDSLKSPLKVRFAGEEGIDEGGITKEFFQLLMEQLMNPDYGMFIYADSSSVYWIMSEAFGSQVQFELVGIILGLAVYNHVILNVTFPAVMYKKFLCRLSKPADAPTGQDEPSMPPAGMTGLARFVPPRSEESDTTNLSYVRAKAMSTSAIVNEMARTLPEYIPIIDDLDDLYPDVAKGLRQTLMMAADEVEALALTFSLTVDRFGEKIDVPLKLGYGSEVKIYDANEPVTGENREDYVRAVLQYYLVDSIAHEFSAIYRGFHRCCGGPALKHVTSSDLQLLICGPPGDLDFGSLRAGAKYDDGYTESSPQIKWFWEICEEMSQEDKMKLLFYITGSDRTPAGGLASLRLSISRAGGDIDRFPTAHTCFNHLLLPLYNSKEQMAKYLHAMLEHRHGFGLR